jgi:phage tail P2-like protein
MKLADLKFIDLLPEFMRDDPANIAFAFAVDETIHDLAPRTALLSRWDHIDELPEQILDELAKDLNISWYLDMTPIETKRKLIKDSDATHSTLGTVWSIENIIAAYFGDSRIVEWFEYGGNPGCFKVVTGDVSVTNERTTEFLRLLEIIKRKSAHLDGIYVTLTGWIEMMPAVFVHETSFEKYVALAE